jgi:TP901 family phage tail tape measure protein
MAQEIRQKLSFDAQNAITNLDNLAKKLVVVNSQLERMNTLMQKTGLDKVTKKFNEAGNSAGKAGGKIRRFLQAFTGINPITAGLRFLTAGMREAVVESTKFGLKIAEIQTIGAGMEKTNEQISASVMRLSNQFGVAAGDVAEGLYQTLSNQVVDAADATDFLEASMKLAKVTVASSSEAINALSSVLNTYKERAGGATEASDVLFKMVEFGRLRLGDVGNILGRVLPLTSQMGVEFKEAAAAIAVMTRQGVKADTAVTQLRAVMQKIIKPTESMQKLFRSWGVKDGPDAIKTFGGLYNVLRKMSDEVGGSNAEMAEYFRRVRAIVGQMSLLNDNGELMIETMNEMEDATGAVAEAWKKFNETDAQKLTRTWIEFKNAIIQAGQQAAPFLTTFIDAMGFALKVSSQLVRNIEKFYNPMARVKHQLQDLQAYWENLPELVIEPAKVMEKEYKEAAQKARQSLLPLKQEFYRLSDAMQASADRMVNITAKKIEEIADNYKGILSGLKKIIDEGPKAAKKAADKIGKIQQGSDDRQLERRLRGAKTEYAKRQILEQQYQKLQRKLSSITSKQQLTEQDFAQAERLHGQMIELANSQEIRASEEERWYAEQKWKGRQSSADKQLVNLEARRAQQAAKNAELAKKASDALKDDAKTVKEITDQINDQLRVKGESALKKGPAARQAEEAADRTIKELKAQLEKYVIPDRGKDFLRSLGMDPSGVDALNKAITEGLNSDLKRLNLDLQDIQKQLNSQTFNIRVALNEDELRKQAKALDIPLAEDMEIFDLKEAVSAKAESLSVKDSDARQKIEHLTIAAKGFAELLGKVEVGIVMPSDVSDFEGSKGISPAAMVKSLFGSDSQYEAELAANKQAIANRRNERKGITPAYVDAVREMNVLRERYEQGLGVDAGKLDALKIRFGQLLESGDLSVFGKKALTELLGPLTQLQEKMDEVDRHKEDLIKPEQQSFVDKILEDNTKLAPKLDEINTKTNQGKTALEGQATAAGKAVTPVQNTATAAGNVNTQAGLAGANIQQWGPSANTSLGPLSAVFNMVTQIRDRALEAKAAVAATGGGDVSGGAHRFGKFFSYGGRGTDTIPAMLSEGESVISARNSRRFSSQLNAMNQGSQPVYREQGGSVTNVGDINVSVNGGDSSQQTVREVGRALRREIQRGTIKLR